MRLLLIRHGIAEGQEGRVIGHADPELSARGREEMAALAATAGARPDLLVSSDLRRAVASAEILAAGWGVDIAYDARLRELAFGEWEGRTWKELEREDGGRLSRWMSDWIQLPAPGGESFADLVARASEWLAELRESGVGGAGTVVVVAHAGSIRAILCRVLGVPLEEAFGFDVGYGRVTEVWVSDSSAPGALAIRRTTG